MQPTISQSSHMRCIVSNMSDIIVVPSASKVVSFVELRSGIVRCRPEHLVVNVGYPVKSTGCQIIAHFALYVANWPFGVH